MTKNRILFLFCLLLTLASTRMIHADDKAATETKVSPVKHVYQFSSAVVYILEDGYSLYQHTKSKKAWKQGDEVVVKDPYAEFFDDDDSDEEMYVDVKNLTRKKDATCLRYGWTTSQPNTIVSTHSKKSKGSTVVTITLDDNTQWKFKYFDETAHTKYWKKGEKVLLFVDTHDHSPHNPLPLSQYRSKYSFEMVNIDNKHHLTGEPPKPVK